MKEIKDPLLPQSKRVFSSKLVLFRTCELFGDSLFILGIIALVCGAVGAFIWYIIHLAIFTNEHFRGPQPEWWFTSLGAFGEWKTWESDKEPPTFRLQPMLYYTTFLAGIYLPVLPMVIFTSYLFFYERFKFPCVINIVLGLVTGIVGSVLSVIGLGFGATSILVGFLELMNFLFKRPHSMEEWIIGGIVTVVVTIVSCILCTIGREWDEGEFHEEVTGV